MSLLSVPRTRGIHQQSASKEILMADRATLLNTNGCGTARWLVHLDPHDTVERSFRRAYVYADTAEQAIAKTKELAMPDYFKQYMENSNV